MNFYDFWKSLSEKERKEFSSETDISERYISTQLIYRYKIPPLNKLRKMAEASNGKLDFHNLCDFFSNVNELELA